MDQVVGLRPFVPARDFELSKRFYQALGFRITHEEPSIAMLKLAGFSFILQNFYVREAAETLMLQLLVRDADAWWRQVQPEEALRDFDIKPPRPPSLQSWGMKVGFIVDPSGVLWHVAEIPF